MYVTPAEQSAWLTGGDPEGAGRAFAERIINYDFQLAKEKGTNGRLLVDAWMSLNEPVRGPASFPDGNPDAETLARYDALDRFQAAFLERLRAEGLEGVAFNFAAGNFTRKNDIVQYFPRTLAAYTYLGLHEYGWPNLMPRADTSSSALTYRTVMEGIRERYGNRHKLIITEAGLARMYRYPNDPAGDVGWLYGGETISEDQYWQSLAWYNNQMLQDDYVMGASLYQVGHGGRWETFRHLGVNNQGQPILLMDKIATLNSTAAPPPPPAEPPPTPVPPPGDERAKLLARVRSRAVRNASCGCGDRRVHGGPGEGPRRPGTGQPRPLCGPHPRGRAGAARPPHRARRRARGPAGRIGRRPCTTARADRRVTAANQRPAGRGAQRGRPGCAGQGGTGPAGGI